MENSWLLPLTVFLPWAGALLVLAAGRAAKLRIVLAIENTARGTARAPYLAVRVD